MFITLEVYNKNIEKTILTFYIMALNKNVLQIFCVPVLHKNIPPISIF